jgi:hypothetical protein
MTERENFQFWYFWLLLVSVLNLVAGLLIALFPGSFLFELHTVALAEAFFGENLTESTEQMRRFFFGIIGGTIAGYFLLQTLIVIFPFRNRECWSWHAIFWAILLWFLIDSTLSIVHGAFFNVWMINIPSLLLIMIPLLFTIKFFHGGYTEAGVH